MFYFSPVSLFLSWSVCCGGSKDERGERRRAGQKNWSSTEEEWGFGQEISGEFDLSAEIWYTVATLPVCLLGVPLVII